MAGASPIVKSLNAELDELRRVLDSPNPLGSAHPLKSPNRSVSHHQNTSSVSHDHYAEFSSVIGNAETNVGRLSRAMQSAEGEMEKAFQRSSELHRSSTERKEAEVQELRKVLAAKERAIDSLRDTLSTTRRTLEERLSQSESREHVKEAEIRQLRAELSSFKSRSDNLQSKVEVEVKATRQVLEEAERKESTARARERELETTLTALTQEQEKTIATLAKVKSSKDKVKLEKEGLEREVLALREKVEVEVSMRREVTLKYEREKKYRKIKEKRDIALTSVHDLELSKELEMKLKAERRLRKGAERWLQAERYTKEELEDMLGTMRDLVISRPEMELRELRRTVDVLKDERHAALWRAEEEVLRKQRDYDFLHNSLEKDNLKLRDEIRRTRKMVNKTKRYKPGYRVVPYGPSTYIDGVGAIWARCRRCGELFDMNHNSAYACGYHPGDLSGSGYACCGVLPRPGTPAVFCHWRTHSA